MNSNENVTLGNSTASSDSTSNYTSGNSEYVSSSTSCAAIDPFDKKYEKVASFVSQPYFKIFLWNGAGIYILNAFSFNYFPRFYFMRSKTFLEFGLSWLGILAEFMWNKAFEVNK